MSGSNNGDFSIPVVERSGDVLMEIGRRVPAFAQGLQLQSSGRTAEARQVFLQLTERPELTAPSLHQLGVMAAYEGDNLRAAGLFEHALKIEPGETLYYCSLGTVFERMGDLPHAAGIMVNLAVMLQTRGQHADAIPLYRRILALSPLNYSAWVNMGTGLAWMGQSREAVVPLIVGVILFGRVLPEARDLGKLLIEEIGDRLPELTAALATLPEGMPDGRLERLEEVLQTLDKALRTAGFIDATVMALDVALKLAPGNALARWNHSLACLARGDFATGWADYEWRWVWDQFPEPRRILAASQWRGEELAGKRIYVWGEQGFGDILQFAPLARILMDRHAPAEVVLEVSSPLVGILGIALARLGIRVVSRPDNPHRFGVEEAFDYHIPLLSLPHMLSLRVPDLPLMPGWLVLPEEQVARGRGLLPPPSGKRRIGVVWAGRPQHSEDARRSLPLAHLGAVLDAIPDAEWFSLQVGPRAGDALAFKGRLHDLSPQLKDFIDTAAIIANLDHVVAVDTGVGHLAGCMGKPVSLLLAHSVDWRWGIGDTTSPWYPNHRIHRQPALGDWPGVIASLRAEHAQPAAAPQGATADVIPPAEPKRRGASSRRAAAKEAAES
ncbi:tetratricopeptide repeat-containing glycosyltransferase family protein [Nitrospirillum sp. BR 11752]|uniref:tetratricopeptide repeat-containing glycosyltransferase family protein n=1 Tax=Nitrospirillum sp. BR 11752 TaxID=3104293 RepID=UPI002EAD8B30|nr:tetratricopeptide repeat-containing glycosyltransferase family protein [Nitrospirillum sp. BR 11752]